MRSWSYGQSSAAVDTSLVLGRGVRADCSGKYRGVSGSVLICRKEYSSNVNP